MLLEDDGLFLMAGAHLGVAHPPGYPIHTLIVHLFTRLPFGDPAVLGHLSAVLGALACGAVYGCARLLRASPVPALAAAWLLGMSEQFWSQAIITEVYTLNALLFFAAWALVPLPAGLRRLSAPRRRRRARAPPSRARALTAEVAPRLARPARARTGGRGKPATPLPFPTGHG